MKAAAWGFRRGLGIRAKDSTTVSGFGFGVSGLGFRGLGFRVSGFGFGALGFRVSGLGFKGLGV